MTRLIVNRFCVLLLIIAFAPFAAASEVPIGETHGRLVLPQKWDIRDDLNDDADLQAAHDRQGLYLVVLTDIKEDLTYQNVAEYAVGRIVPLQDSLTNVVLSEPVDSFIAGLPAVTYRLDGVLDSARISYLLTYIEGEEFYYQILAWGTRSSFRKGEAVLREILASFKE